MQAAHSFLRKKGKDRPAGTRLWLLWRYRLQIIFLLFCVCVEADCLKAKLTPVRELSMMFSECPTLRRCLNFKRPASNVFFWKS